MANLKQQFPADFSNSLVEATAPAHGTEHHVTMMGKQATTNFQWLDPIGLVAAKQEFQATLAEGDHPLFF
jgi:hypothetical protein